MTAYIVATFENGTWTEVFTNEVWGAARNFFWKMRKAEPTKPWRVTKGDMVVGNYDPKWKVRV